MLSDPKYDPSKTGGGISSGTKLGPGITCAKFLGARGSRTNFEKHDAVNPDRLQIAKNLYLHAEAIQTIYNNFEFADHRLTVSDGIYTPVGNESPSGINALRITGEAIGYQLINKVGKTDSSKSFDLAVYWKDYIDYEKKGHKSVESLCTGQGLKYEHAHKFLRIFTDNSGTGLPGYAGADNGSEPGKGKGKGGSKQSYSQPRHSSFCACLYHFHACLPPPID